MSFLKLGHKQMLIVSLLFLLSLFLYTFFIQNKKSTSSINWSSAEDMVLSCKIKSVYQSSTGVVTLKSKSGESFITNEPSKDAIWELVDSVSTSCTPVFDY